MKPLTIGQVAKRAGVNVETVRYYERQGLIPEPPRRASGYRQYNPDFVRRIQFIKRAQSLGFSLKEIVELLELRIEPNIACDDVRLRAEQKIADIEQKIETLQRMKQVLDELVIACNHREPTNECPILATLDSVGDI
ncbi:MAG: Hg(II)-responsive transcriptional regulator [Anaerolineae bacterium]|nr:Hg(II)-responsive transcriptional regulator [Anaerolineae bacterium]